MPALANNDFQCVKNTLSVNEIRNRLTETENMMDSFLSRITRLQMILHLEEARLLRSQEEYNELQAMLGDTESF